MTALKVAIAGYYGFDNFGDELILEVLVTWLKQLGCEPVVLSANPTKTQAQYGVAAISRTDMMAIWRTFCQADAFLLGGGGLFQDKTGLASPVYYGGLMLMAHLASCPTAFFGQGVGPLSSPLSLSMLKWVMPKASLVVVRDDKSRQTLESLTKQSISVMGDPAWMLSDLLEVEAKTNGKAFKPLAISLRPWPELTEGVIEELAQQIMQWPGVHQAGVNLIVCQPAQDTLPLSKLSDILQAQDVPINWIDEQHVIQGIRESGALIGMRFHALLVAACLDIPVVGLAYDPKVTFLMEKVEATYYEPQQWSALSDTELVNELHPLASQNLTELKQSAKEGFERFSSWLTQR